MYRSKKNKVFFKFSFCVAKTLVFLVLFVFPFFAFAKEVSVLGFLEKSLDKLEWSLSNRVSGQAIVEDIYEKSLNLVKSNEMKPLTQSISDTKNNLNSTYACSMTDDDIVNILFYANTSFKRAIKDVFEGSYQKPSKSSMSSSCSKLFECAYKKKVSSSPDLNSKCQSEVSNVFVKIYTNRLSMDSVGSNAQGNNNFWNASLDDSSYDIMDDIYNLAQILFESVDKPVETLYFEMPKVENVAPYQAPSTQVVVDRFSPYNTYITETTQTGTQGTGVIYGSGQNVGSDDVSNSTNTFEGFGLDEDIQNFVSTVNYTSNEYSSTNPGSLSLGNECVSGFEYEFYEEGGEVVETITTSGYAQSGSISPYEYLSGVLQDLEAMSCNHNYICESWESLTCPDCISTNGGTEDIQEIYELVNSAESAIPPELQDEVLLSCMQNCSAQQCTPTSCPKLVCYAKCACQTIESPFFDPQQYPGLSPVFKIKFCIIPATDTSIDSKKMVYNIFSIFQEIYNVLQKLRDSGQLMVSIKTNELLDSSYKENNFAKQISFMITSDTKGHSSKQSEYAREKEQIDMNTNLQDSVLGFSETSNLMTEKNKYVIVDNPCEYSSTILGGDPDSYERWLQNCRDNKNENNVSMSGGAVASQLGQSEVVMVDGMFYDFLSRNADFWRELKTALEDFNAQAKILFEKK